jgi:ribose 5-phosphate isomerase B
MKIAVVSDEPYAVNETVANELVRRGHEVVRFGSLASGGEVPWAEAAQQAAEAVASGACDEGVFFCWTGTGISMAANKVPGIRAALCTDPETARGARIWNHANVLALSNRLTSDERAREILDAWLSTKPDDPRGEAGVAGVRAIETKWRKGP